MVDRNLFSIAKGDQLPIRINSHLGKFLWGVQGQKDSADLFDVLADKLICIEVWRLETFQFIAQFPATVQLCPDIINFSLISLFFVLIFCGYGDFTCFLMEIFAKNTDSCPVQFLVCRYISHGIPKGRILIQSRSLFMKLLQLLFCSTMILLPPGQIVRQIGRGSSQKSSAGF